MEVLPRFVGRVMNGLSPIVFGDGSTGRDFTYVTEVARGILAAGRHDALVGQKVNIAIGRMVTVADLARTVLTTLGRNDLAITMLPPRPGDVHQLHADTTKAAAMLGFRAEIGLEDGVRRYIDWVRARYPDPAVLVETAATNWQFDAAAKE